jgi:hypothetical protein
MSEEESLERVERVGRALENDFKSGGTPKLNVVFLYIANCRRAGDPSLFSITFNSVHLNSQAAVRVGGINKHERAVELCRR